MSLPPLLPDNSPSQPEFFRRVRDLVNATVRRTSNNGPTSERPKNPSPGWTYFDTTLNRPIWFTGTNWINAAGTVV